jgi:hypothetical protein
MVHAQKPDFIFRLNGRVHLNRRGRQFGRLLAAGVCASAVVMLDRPRSEVVWTVLATHSIRQFPLRFPSRRSPCAITFQLDSTSNGKHTRKQQWTQVALALRTLGNFIPLQASTGPKLSRRLRLPKSPDNRNMKMVRLSVLRTSRLYLPGNIPGTHLCYRLSRFQGHIALQINAKFQGHHRESNPRSASTKSVTACPNERHHSRYISCLTNRSPIAQG